MFNDREWRKINSTVRAANTMMPKGAGIWVDRTEFGVYLSAKASNHELKPTHVTDPEMARAMMQMMLIGLDIGWHAGFERYQSIIDDVM